MTVYGLSKLPHHVLTAMQHISSIVIPGTERHIVILGCPGLVITQSGELDLSESLLADHLDELRRRGVALLISLVEEEELGFVAYEDITDAAEAMGIDVVRFPVRDFTAPSDGQLHVWNALWGSLEAVLSEGGAVALHCLAGDGRSGMMAADLLKRHGLSGAEALDVVRNVRPGAIETDAQVRFVVSDIY